MDQRTESEIVRASTDPSRQFGRYLVLSELGRGGMGIVYRCWDAPTSRLVAIKLLLARTGVLPEDLQRFQLEARATAKLNHRGIVGIHEFGERDGDPFIVMDFVEGEPLTAWLARKPSPVRVAAVGAEVARALHHAHKHGIIHRDIKPANILLSAEGREHSPRPVVTDFGLAADQGAQQRLTLTGETLGTPGYMAPEQVQGLREQIGPASDVWSLGVILFQALTGQLPFHGASAVETFTKILVDPAPKLAGGGFPPRLAAAIDRCLAKESAERFPKASALADELERVIAEASAPRAVVAAPARPPSQRTRRSSRRVAQAAPTAPTESTEPPREDPRAISPTLALGAFVVVAFVASFGMVVLLGREDPAPATVSSAADSATSPESPRTAEPTTTRPPAPPADEPPADVAPDAGPSVEMSPADPSVRETDPHEDVLWVRAEMRLAARGSIPAARGVLDDVTSRSPHAAVAEERARWTRILDDLEAVNTAITATLHSKPSVLQLTTDDRIQEVDEDGVLYAWPLDEPRPPTPRSGTIERLLADVDRLYGIHWYQTALATLAPPAPTTAEQLRRVATSWLLRAENRAVGVAAEAERWRQARLVVQARDAGVIEHLRPELAIRDPEAVPRPPQKPTPEAEASPPSAIPTDALDLRGRMRRLTSGGLERASDLLVRLAERRPDADSDLGRELARWKTIVDDLTSWVTRARATMEADPRAVEYGYSNPNADTSVHLLNRWLRLQRIEDGVAIFEPDAGTAEPDDPIKRVPVDQLIDGMDSKFGNMWYEASKEPAPDRDATLRRMAAAWLLRPRNDAPVYPSLNVALAEMTAEARARGLIDHLLPELEEAELGPGGIALRRRMHQLIDRGAFTVPAAREALTDSLGDDPRTETERARWKRIIDDLDVFRRAYAAGLREDPTGVASFNWDGGIRLQKIEGDVCHFWSNRQPDKKTTGDIWAFVDRSDRYYGWVIFDRKVRGHHPSGSTDADRRRRLATIWAVLGRHGIPKFQAHIKKQHLAEVERARDAGLLEHLAPELARRGVARRGATPRKVPDPGPERPDPGGATPPADPAPDPEGPTPAPSTDPSHVAVLEGSTTIEDDPPGVVTTLAWDPRGRYLAVGHADGDVVLWSASARRPKVYRRFEVDAPIVGVAFFDAGTKLVAATCTGQLVVWKTSGRRPLEIVETGTTDAAGFALRPGDGVVALWSGATVRVFSPAGAVIAERELQGAIRTAAWSPSGRLGIAWTPSKGTRLSIVDIVPKAPELGEGYALETVALFNWLWPKGSQLDSLAFPDGERVVLGGPTGARQVAIPTDLAPPKAGEKAPLLRFVDVETAWFIEPGPAVLADANPRLVAAVVGGQLRLHAAGDGALVAVVDAVALATLDPKARKPRIAVVAPGARSVDLYRVEPRD